MCGMDPTGEVTRKKLKDGEFFKAEHVRRDMQHMLESLAFHCEATGEFLLSDEGALLRQIADDYGLEWPEQL